LPQDTTI
jgi:hypothetical protein